MEAVLLSTKDRGPAVRIPSAAMQRVQIARIAKRRVFTSSGSCGDIEPFLAFPEGTSVDTLRAALAGSGLSLGESTVEGKARIVAYAGDLDKAARMATVSKPQILCGTPVIERAMEQVSGP